MNHPSVSELHKARQIFESLISKKAKENQFQKLFTECPFIFSHSLPLQLDPADIVPLGRPGISEPDFIFYPKKRNQLYSHGVIELKKPSTKLITLPRKDLILLSRDAETAVKQSYNYSFNSNSEIFTDPQQNLIIGNRKYVFIIAGLSDELNAKISTPNFLQQINQLVPQGCSIIPYDILLEMYSSAIPPQAFVLRPVIEKNDDSLDLILNSLEQNKDRIQLNVHNIDLWTKIEDDWRELTYLGRQIPRWRIIKKDQWSLSINRKQEVEFPKKIKYLIKIITDSIKIYRLIKSIQSNGINILNLNAYLSAKQFSILKEATKRCIERNVTWTYIYPHDGPDMKYLENIGLITFDNYDSGDHHFRVDPLLIELFKRQEII